MTPAWGVLQPHPLDTLTLSGCPTLAELTRRTFWVPGVLTFQTTGGPTLQSLNISGGIGRIWDRQSYVGKEWKSFFLPKPSLYRALPSYGQMLVSLDLIKFVGLNLMTPWDPTPPQWSVDTQPVPGRLGIPCGFCWVASDPALPQGLNHISLLNTTHPYLVTHWESISCNSSTAGGFFTDWS